MIGGATGLTGSAMHLIPGAVHLTTAHLSGSSGRRVGTPAQMVCAASVRIELPIHGVDECVGDSVTAVVIERRTGGFHLLHRLATSHERLDAIANDGHHIAVLDDVGFVAQAAVAGDDVRASLFVVLRNRSSMILLSASNVPCTLPPRA